MPTNEPSKDFYDWLRTSMHKINVLCQGNAPYYRGMSPKEIPSINYDSDFIFSLVPKIARSEYINYLDAEHSAFMTFKNLAGNQVEGLSGWEILTLMRHHDIPTRFLDWTESFDIALYFALSGLKKLKQDTDVAIWVLDPTKLNFLNNLEYVTLYSLEDVHPYKVKNTENRNLLIAELRTYIGAKTPEDVKSFLDEIQGKDSYKIFVELQNEKNKFLKSKLISGEITKEEFEKSLKKSSIPKQNVLFVIPPRKHMRILAQKSFFTLHYDLNPLNKLYKNSNCLEMIKLPKEMISDARHYLRLNDLNEHTLFPELDGLARHINQSYFNEGVYWSF